MSVSAFLPFFAYLDLNRKLLCTYLVQEQNKEYFLNYFRRYVVNSWKHVMSYMYLSSSSESEDDEEEESFLEMFLLIGLAFNSTGLADFLWIFFCLLKKSRSFVLSSLPPEVELSRLFTLGWSNVPLSLNIFLGSNDAVMVKYDMNHSKFVKNRGKLLLHSKFNFIMFVYFFGRKRLRDKTI